MEFVSTTMFQDHQAAAVKPEKGVASPTLQVSEGSIPTTPLHPTVGVSFGRSSVEGAVVMIPSPPQKTEDAPM